MKTKKNEYDFMCVAKKKENFGWMSWKRGKEKENS